MNLLEELDREHSKAQMMLVTDYIGSDKKRFAKLVEIFLGDDHRACQRSSWVFTTVAERHPKLVAPYLEDLLANFDKPDAHNAVIRNTLRTFQYIDIPEDIAGRLFNICFAILCSPKQEIAFRAFSITVLYRITEMEPELKRELQTALEEVIEEGPTAAISGRGRKVLIKLSKEI